MDEATVRAAQAAYEKAKRDRIDAVKAASSRGVSLRRLAEWLGMRSAGSVQRILNRRWKGA